LYIQAEDALKENIRLKKELLSAIKSDVEDYEFQPILHYAALCFHWINENEIRSYRSNWLNAVVYSSAWDFMTVAFMSRNEREKCEEYTSKAKSIAVRVNSKMMLNMIERHQRDYYFMMP
jgi:predicted DNA binding CopG/RHH family protein